MGAPRYIHILRDNHIARPWWVARERFDCPADERIWCDCCNAYGMADEVEVRLWADEIPVGGAGCYQDPDALGGFNSGWSPRYFDPRWETRCGEGFGCTVSPRRRASAHLRERW